jgi:hypothetical protein
MIQITRIDDFLARYVNQLRRACASQCRRLQIEIDSDSNEMNLDQEKNGFENDFENVNLSFLFFDTLSTRTRISENKLTKRRRLDSVEKKSSMTKQIFVIQRRLDASSTTLTRRAKSRTTTTQDDAKKKNADDENNVDAKIDDDELTRRENDDDETQKISKNETTRRETNVDENFSQSRLNKKALSKRKRT